MNIEQFRETWEFLKTNKNFEKKFRDTISKLQKEKYREESWKSSHFPFSKTKNHKKKSPEFPKSLNIASGQELLKKRKCFARKLTFKTTIQNFQIAEKEANFGLQNYDNFTKTRAHRPEARGGSDGKEGNEGKSFGNSLSRRCSSHSSFDSRGPHMQRRMSQPLALVAMQVS